MEVSVLGRKTGFVTIFRPYLYLPVALCQVKFCIKLVFCKFGKQSLSSSHGLRIKDRDPIQGPVVRTHSFTPVLFLDNDNRCRIWRLSLIHISEPTRLLSISYAVFC